MGVRVDRDGRVFTIVCEGTYAADDLIEAFDAIVARADLPEDPVLVLDVRRSESLLSRSITELRRVAQHFTSHARHVGRRLAIVVEGPARYGLMRMAAAWASFDGSDVRVFLDRDEAVRWLSASDRGAA
jgi:hypothetical protein